jgi:riboflavin kinase
MSLGWVQEVLRERLGFAPYPATLNLRLESEGQVEEWERIRGEVEGVDVPPPLASFCRARCFHVVIEVLREGARAVARGAVLLPAVGGYPPDKLEVVAPVHLKGSLGLRDGDRVSLAFVESRDREGR